MRVAAHGVADPFAALAVVLAEPNSAAVRGILKPAGIEHRLHARDPELRGIIRRHPVVGNFDH